MASKKADMKIEITVAHTNSRSDVRGTDVIIRNDVISTLEEKYKHIDTFKIGNFF